MNRVENGVCCPLTMTYAALPALAHEPRLAADWKPRITATAYDPRPLPAGEKTAATIGMAMTEKQGGSDVRANTTRATPAESGGEYRLTGHKWFCSAPMSDAFLTLAQAREGLTCFLVPRWLPGDGAGDGAVERNPFALQRLKDKLGNRSNASAEIEYRDTRAWRVGAEGRGVPTIIDMVHHTRLDCALGSAAILRQAVAQALHHAAHRRAFGRRLIEQPLMAAVLAELAVESEAATALALRLARAFDEAPADPAAAAFSRLATAVGKYWITKRLPALVVEALECHGGNGYVEESSLPRLYREAPLNSIWEGSGNVMCLDVLRAIGRQPESLDAFLAELERGRGGDRRLDAYLDRLRDRLAGGVEEAAARRLVERLALALQGSLLVRHAPPAVADAFVAARLAGDGGLAAGTLPPGAAVGDIIRRARLETA